MFRKLFATSVASTITMGVAFAQPQIISLGGGIPNSVTPDVSGSHYIGGSGLGGTGASRWTLTGATLSGVNYGGTGGGLLTPDGAFSIANVLNTNPQLSGNTATGVTPPFSMTPTLVPALIAATEGRGARWDASGGTFTSLGGLPIVPELMVYGSGSSGGSTGSFLSPHSISQNGRFVVGQGYISTYNSAAGTTIALSTFQWRGWVWDAQANGGAGGITVLPTPFRTSTNTWRRRTCNAYAVSNDGLVVFGAQEHNVGTTPTADPDGGRLVVWRWNSGTSAYEMSYLPNGVNGSGFPYTYSTTPGTYFMNAAGTMIVGMAIDNDGNAFLGKWTWDSGTSTWSTAANLGTTLATPASWLPGSVTSCGLPPLLTPTGMSADGNTVVGVARYSTCGSFMSGGFIWTAASGVITDWYDYLRGTGAAGVKEYYGPVGDGDPNDPNNFDPNRGLARLGFPSGIAIDGSAIVGFQGGNQLIPGATPWIVLTGGGPGCVAPVITTNPAATTLISACTTSIILNAGAAGTRPVSYQWFKDGSPLVDGDTGSGSTIVGATSFQMRVNGAGTADVGVYHCEITGPCGSPAVTTDAFVQIDPAFTPATNDTCAGAMVVTSGTNVLAPAQSPCAAYTLDPTLGASCVTTATKLDRWFVFTPGETRNYRVETCGSNYDTVLSIFDGCGGGELACNNDYTTGPSAGCSSTRSRIGSILLTASTPYYIRIAAPAAAFTSSTSTMNLSILDAPTPAANDACQFAAPAVLGANAFDTTEATNDGVALTCNGTSHLTRDVWFTYTPTYAGKLRAATCPGTTMNTVLSLHDGACGVELACNDNANVTGCSTQSVIDNFVMAGGATVHIRVAGNSLSTFGAGTLTLSYRCDTDIDGNGTTELTDLAILLTNFGTASGATPAMGDIDGDQDVDLTDLAYLLSVFGAQCS